jgi:tRNA threonylcarbamoyladenosine biosynthesis protein TsaB
MPSQPLVPLVQLLAFDTSTETMAVAAQGPHGTVFHEGEGGAAASAALLPVVHDLLARAGLSLHDLDAIAFARGPGAFTGLRTACSVAQGLAFGVQRPVVPVDSLMLVAEDLRLASDDPQAPLDVGVAMDARMGEIYAARYCWDGRGWEVAVAPLLCAPQDLARRLGGLPPRRAGTGWVLSADAAGPGPAVQAATRHRAAALLSLAQSLWHAGATAQAAQALPLYLRDKVALTTAERAAAAAA